MRFYALLLILLLSVACSGASTSGLAPTTNPNGDNHYTIATNPTKPTVNKTYTISGTLNYQSTYTDPSETNSPIHSDVLAESIAVSANVAPIKIQYEPAGKRCNPSEAMTLVAMAPGNSRTAFEVKANEEFSIELPEGAYELYFFQNYGESDQLMCSSLMYSDIDDSKKLGGLYAGIDLNQNLNLGNLTEFTLGQHFSASLNEIAGSIDLNKNGHLDEYIEQLDTTLLPDLNVLNMSPYNSGIVSLWGETYNTGFIYIRLDDIVTSIDSSKIKITAQNDESAIVEIGAGSNITFTTDSDYNESIIQIKIQNTLQAQGKYTFVIDKDAITTASARTLPETISTNFTARRRLNQDNVLQSQHLQDLLAKFSN